MIELRDTSISSSFTIHKAGIEFTNDLTYEEYLKLVQFLDTADKGLHFCIGDVLNQAEKQWGEKYKEATEKTEFDYQTLRNDKWIAASVHLSRRRDKLSFGHHAEVASYTPEEQDFLLGQAEALGLSRNKLRELKESLLHPPKVVEPGQTWQLGKHLLYCGDSSSEGFQAMARDAGASFAFADPPYNAGVADWDVSFEWKHDYLIGVAPIVAVTPGLASLFSFAKNTQMPFKWPMSYWIDNGMTRGALGFGNWICVALFTEDSLYRKSQDLIRVVEDEDMQQISITGGDHDDFKHKGRKPLEMMVNIIGLFSKQDEVVVDPFLGTGTTLIACEQLERRCIGAELEPSFCEHIIKRWEKQTGEEAKLCQ